MSAPPPSHPAEPVAAGRLDLAESIRRLIVAATTGSASAHELAAARDLVVAATSALGWVPTVDGHRAETESGRRPSVNPFGSAENPLAPPLREVRSEDGEYVAELALSPAYEGPPGRVHGGVVTGILDHASGFALRSLGVLAVSVSLTISLHEPTPYGVPLVVNARVSEREGRKIWVDASLSTAAGHRTASCRTLMIELLEAPAWGSLPWRA